MADNTPIAHLSAIQGEAFVKDRNGVLRQLELDAPIFDGEVVVTGDGARIELALLDTRTFVVDANETFTMDAEVIAMYQPDASDAALLVVGNGFDKVIQAINEDGSLDALLAATAAGNISSNLGGGASFTRLLHVIEAFDPPTVELDTGRHDLIYECTDSANALDLAGTTEIATFGNATLPPEEQNATGLMVAADASIGGSLFGVDVFQCALSEHGRVDTLDTTNIITGFSSLSRSQGGDVLDLHGFLQGEGIAKGNLANYLHFERRGSNTIVHINATGGYATGFNPELDDQRICLSNVDLIGSASSDEQVIQNLLTAGKLIVD
jgi:hypothetical protein